MVDRRYVLILLSTETERSAVALVTGTVKAMRMRQVDLEKLVAWKTTACKSLLLSLNLIV